MHKLKALLIPVTAQLILFSTTSMAVSLTSNVGLGYGTGTQKFDSKSFDPASFGGHFDLQLNFWKLLVGLNYDTITQFNSDNERDYVGFGGIHAGVNMSNSIQLIGGYGLGKWRKRTENAPGTPSDFDYQGSGNGYMAGLRIFFINTKFFSVGVSGTYFAMTSDKYSAVEDGIKTEPKKSSEGSGMLTALVVRLSGADFDKYMSKYFK